MADTKLRGFLLVVAALLLWTACGGSDSGSNVRLPPPPEVDVSAFGEQPQLLLEEGLSRLNQYPDDAALNGHVGMLLHAFGSYEDAVKFYARARKQAPAAGRWSYYQGVALAELDEVAAAAEAFNTNLEYWTDYGPTRLRLANLYFQAGEAAKSDALLQKGRETLDSLASSQPDYAPGLIAKAKQLAADGDEDAAIALLKKAIDDGYSGREAHLALADIYAAQGLEDEAGRYEVLAQRRPELGLDDAKWMGRIKAFKSSNMAYSDRGEALVRARMLGPATDEFERAIEAGESELDARVNLVALYGMQGDIDKAQQHYNMALRDGLENGSLHLNMGTILLGLGNHAEAEEAFQKAIAVDPFLVKAYQGMSRSNLLQKNHGQAVRWARMAVQREPKNVRTLVELARALSFAEEYDESIDYFEQAATYSEGEDQIQTLRSMSGVQLKAKDFEGAKASLQRARELAANAGNNVQTVLIDAQINEVAEAAQTP